MADAKRPNMPKTKFAAASWLIWPGCPCAAANWKNSPMCANVRQLRATKAPTMTAAMRMNAIVAGASTALSRFCSAKNVALSGSATLSLLLHRRRELAFLDRQHRRARVDSENKHGQQQRRDQVHDRDHPVGGQCLGFGQRCSSSRVVGGEEGLRIADLGEARAQVGTERPCHPREARAGRNQPLGAIEQRKRPQ